MKSGRGLPPRSRRLAGACLAAALAAAFLHWRPGLAQRGFAKSEEDVQIRNLRTNVDRAFLWNYLTQHKDKVAPASADIRNAGSRLVKATGAAFNQNCHFYTIALPKVNAMASPGGNIFIYQGILDLKLSGDEVAGVIAHEVAHVALGHWLEQLKNNMQARVLTAYAARTYGSGSAEIVSLSKTLDNLKYKREQERDADMAGMQLMVDAGFAPRGLPDALRKVADTPQQRAAAAKDPRLSSHPDIAERIARCEHAIRTGLIRKRKRRLRAI